MIPLKDLREIEDGNLGTEDQDTEAPKESQPTPIVALRRSSRIIIPPQRNSSTLHYIQLTDRGEPESYGEAMQDKESAK